jgi:hypothetical protein
VAPRSRRKIRENDMLEGNNEIETLVRLVDPNLEGFKFEDKA